MRRPNLIVKKRKSHAKALIIGLMFSLGLAAYTSNQFDHASKKDFQEIKLATKNIANPVTVAKPNSHTEVVYDELTEIEKKFNKHKIHGLESLDREEDSHALKITLSSDVFFRLGTAKFEDSSQESILEIINILKPISTNALIEIEGHTDNSPVIRQKPNYPSNWELSAARAASLIPLFSKNGFFKDQLKVVGYGDSRPVVSNRVSQIRSAKNRRIVLRVMTMEDGVKI